MNKSVNRMDVKMGEGKKLNMGKAKVQVVPVTKRLTRQPKSPTTGRPPCAAAGEDQEK